MCQSCITTSDECSCPSVHKSVTEQKADHLFTRLSKSVKLLIFHLEVRALGENSRCYQYKVMTSLLYRNSYTVVNLTVNTSNLQIYTCICSISSTCDLIVNSLAVCLSW